MRTILILTIAFFQSVTLFAQQLTTMEDLKSNNSDVIYQFKVADIYGGMFDLAQLEGKKIMIVNTASECGLTPQYEELQDLYSRFEQDNFIILAFPANNFGQQEPGTNQSIMTFCSTRFGVSFPMMSKISVTGEEIHPLYMFLTTKKLNGLADSEVKWNFQKYLIDAKGKLSMIIQPNVSPLDRSVLNWIESH